MGVSYVGEIIDKSFLCPWIVEKAGVEIIFELL